MVPIFLCYLLLVLLGAVISVVAYFMWRSAEDRDPMIALALFGFYLFMVVLYLIVVVPLIGRWCI